MSYRIPAALLAKKRTRPDHEIRAFEPGIVVASLKARPHDCQCTWVPVPAGFAMKFRQHSCPAQFRHG